MGQQQPHGKWDPTSALQCFSAFPLSITFVLYDAYGWPRGRREGDYVPSSLLPLGNAGCSHLDAFSSSSSSDLFLSALISLEVPILQFVAQPQGVGLDPFQVPSRQIKWIRVHLFISSHKLNVNSPKWGQELIDVCPSYCSMLWQNTHDPGSL